MSQHVSPIEQFPEREPGHLQVPQDARIFDFQTGQEMPAQQPRPAEVYDWQKEGHIGTLSTNPIDFDQHVPESRQTEASLGARIVGTVATLKARAKEEFGLNVVRAPQKEWQRGDNQLDHLPKALRPPR
jgi:hypothetical protein